MSWAFFIFRSQMDTDYADDADRDLRNQRNLRLISDHMKVLFIKDVLGGPKRGQIKDVSDGYAQNFLIPKGFAQIATPEIIARIEKEGKEAEAKKLKEIEKLKHLKAEMEKREFAVKVKVGDKGQVFGGVHEKDIAKAVGEKMGMAIDKSQVELSGIIKEIGMHEAKLNLSSGIIAKIKINIEKQ